MASDQVPERACACWSGKVAAENEGGVDEAEVEAEKAEANGAWADESKIPMPARARRLFRVGESQCIL